VPGIGPIISSAMVAAIGGGDAFSKGRDFAAWLGLVPKQISTGDRTILGKISKRGNRYLRVLFVQAAWAVLIRPKNTGSSRGSKRPRSGCITTSSPSRSPTSSLALRGASWLVVEHSRQSGFKPRDLIASRTNVLPAEVCERMKNEMEDRSSRRMRTLVTQMAH